MNRRRGLSKRRSHSRWTKLAVVSAASIVLVLSNESFLALAAFCSGPRTPGELRNALWGPDSGYDKFTRPSVARQSKESDENPMAVFNETREVVEAPPDVAGMQLHILSVTEVNQKRNEFQVNAWFRQRWNDYRLVYASAKDGGCFEDNQREGFSESTLKELWKPDVFIENQVKVDDNIGSAIWIYPNGDVVYVRALLLTLSCSMDFLAFPRDVQKCSFRVGTWLEDASDVRLNFWESKPAITLASDGIAAHGGSIEWEILDAGGEKPPEDEGHGATQAESYVEFTIQLGRNVDYYTDFVILPTIFMVFISWSSFFIGRGAAPARVGMSMISFLANTNFMSAQLNNLPRLGNDAWLLRFLTISQIFTFYAVIEYVVCNYLRRIEGRIDGGRKRAREVREKVTVANKQLNKRPKSTVTAKNSEFSVECSVDVEDGDGGKMEERPITKQDIKAAGFKHKMDLLLMKKDGKMIFRDSHVEIFSRIVYPISYMVACLVLWYI